MDPYGLAAAALIAAAQATGTEAALAAPDVNGIDFSLLAMFLRADQSLDYGVVMQVMGALNAGGFNNIGLVTDQPRPERDN